MYALPKPGTFYPCIMQYIYTEKTWDILTHVIDPLSIFTHLYFRYNDVFLSFSLKIWVLIGYAQTQRIIHLNGELQPLKINTLSAFSNIWELSFFNVAVWVPYSTSINCKVSTANFSANLSHNLSIHNK